MTVPYSVKCVRCGSFKFVYKNTSGIFEMHSYRQIGMYCSDCGLVEWEVYEFGLSNNCQVCHGAEFLCRTNFEVRRFLGDDFVYKLTYDTCTNCGRIKFKEAYPIKR
jgi:hypothetical protein